RNVQKYLYAAENHGISPRGVGSDGIQHTRYHDPTTQDREHVAEHVVDHIASPLVCPLNKEPSRPLPGRHCSRAEHRSNPCAMLRGLGAFPLRRALRVQPATWRTGPQAPSAGTSQTKIPNS